jgi:methylated-DNA-[protein]-cysteine S-methyltransferase
VATRVTYAADGWGVGELWLDRERLIEHVLPRSTNGLPQAGEHSLATRFRRYFAGERATFEDVELELGASTPFQLAVVVALRSVPYGELVTYGELAAIAGFPGAQRAAGTFCARNRFPIVVPCHRVVAASGLGGFGSLGAEYKRRLIEMERAL